MRIKRIELAIIFYVAFFIAQLIAIEFHDEVGIVLRYHLYMAVGALPSSWFAWELARRVTMVYN